MFSLNNDKYISLLLLLIFCRSSYLFLAELEGADTKQSSPRVRRVDLETVRILSVDGGAVRGIIPATILRNLEKQTGKRIFDIFNIVGSTSIGCLETAVLTTPKDAKKEKSLWEPTMSA